MKMVKIRLVCMVALLIGVITTTTIYINADIKQVSNNIESFKEKFIRFHVLANSDSDKDQELKLKVRDEVIKYLQPLLEKSDSLDNSEEIIKKEMKKLRLISKDVITKNDYDYGVEIELGYSKFPVKQYSNIVLPAGEYKALRILIGDGEGKNWWCVMFPPLCFVDENSSTVDKDTEDRFKNILSEDQFDSIINTKSKKEKKTENKSKFVVKFKVLEVFKNLKTTMLAAK